jgi:hypothetical protein
MTKWMAGLATVVPVVAGVACAATPAEPAEPCKILTASEFQAQFGTAVSTPSPGLKKTPDFVRVSGVKNSLYRAKTGALSVLSGKNLVTVQSVFITAPPVSTVDVQAQLIPLVKLASKRA